MLLTAEKAVNLIVSRFRGPIIVHCSAGIGRTGSIVLIQHAMELLHRPAPLLEIREYLIELRKQRNNSIQTEHQYLYVHQVLLQYLNRARYLDDSVQPYLEEFTRDYFKATKDDDIRESALVTSSST
ncbi:Tyrosine-protein phosphatase [Trichostrongylus colubriformis]|uniref:Tyrosine-protein phosphatase n=1 Tax=Trichostrongylus colubriformis TaxID=6319 RepID=A0AAN8FL08_TRICO